MTETLAVIVALLGAALAVLAFWRDFGDYRARRYQERFTALRSIATEIRNQGPYDGLDASSTSESAHARLLSQFDVESRANAVLYLKAAGRLNRAGSSSFALGLASYGILLIWLLLAGVFPRPADDSRSGADTLVIGQLIIGAIALGSFGRGVLEAARRWSSRGIRLAVGQSDDLTREAWVRFWDNARENRRRAGLGRQWRNP